ncbi:MAG TPA: glycosyltransferase [Candidatus Norongarragalinales archaeon]|nr:glycosyltransferase [Candidatus Norongarragalinales archaeon]
MEKITIGIAAFNEEKVIGQSLESAIRSRPRAAQIIVVASGCTDNTEGVVRMFARRDSRIKLIVERERRGKGSAINQILRSAVGSYIVLTDADLSFPANSVAELVAKFKPRTGAVSGRPEYFARTPMFSWWGRFASECASRQREKRAGKGYHAVSGYLYAIRKGIVRSIPTYAKSEDAFVGEIVRQKGFDIEYAPRAVVNVGYAENIQDYLTQKIRTHYGHLEVFRKAGAANAYETARMAGGIRGEIGEYFKVARGKIASPENYAYFCLYILTEILVWTIAFMKFYLGGEEKWKQVRSTKVIS